MPSLAEIGERIQARCPNEIVGDGAVEILGIASIEKAAAGELTFLTGGRFQTALDECVASAVVLRRDAVDACPTNALVVDDPRLAFGLISHLFDPRPPVPAGIDATAIVDPSASLGADVAIGPYVIVEANVSIGDGVSIGAGAYVGAGTRIGADCRLFPNVTIHHGVRLGARCTIHSGAVLGDDGFGFANDSSGQWHEIKQIGGLVLGDDVSVGSNTTIDRGALNDTTIGNGVQIDNQVQIGHNTTIGDHTLICGQVGIVGSTTIGRHCMLAGGVGIGGVDGVTLTDHVYVTVKTTITQSIDEPGFYSGLFLHKKTSVWKRNALRIGELDQMAKRLARLEKLVDS